MKQCPLYNQHKFNILCHNKPCFNKCSHNVDNLTSQETVIKHEHIHHTECDHLHKCDIPHDININISRTFGLDTNKLDTIHKCNKVCFSNFNDAYESIKNADLKPGEEYILYYRDRLSPSGMSSLMTIGNLNVNEEPIVYVDKTYVDSVYAELIELSQIMHDKIQELEDKLNNAVTDPYN